MHRMRVVASLLLACALAAGCSTSDTSELTADEASLQVRQYLEEQTVTNPQTPGMRALFSHYFSVLAVEVMEINVDGDEARVRCDIAVAPLEPIPAESPDAELFSHIVGRGAKLGPLIVTHTFVFRQYDPYWLPETMDD
jgi:hypothetical protein